MFDSRSFVYTFRNSNQVLNRYNLFNPSLIFDHLHTFYKLIFEAILSLYASLNNLHDRKSQPNTSEFLLPPYESQNLSDIAPRKGIDEKRDEPLKNPELIRNVQIFDSLRKS